DVGSPLSAELDPVQLVLWGDEGERPSGYAHACSAADPVREPLGRVRQLEVDHQADVVDVDPAGGHVGGDEDLASAIAKRGHRPVADGLRQVALELDGVG